MTDVKQPAWRRYLRFWGPDIKADVDAELSFHLEMLASEFRAAGLSDAEARREAMRRFGDYRVVEDDCVRIGEETEQMFRRREFLGRLNQDIRFAFRQLRSNPLLTLTAVFTLAIGIGANTAIFSLVNGVLLRPLPYRDADRLALAFMSLPEYRELEQRTRSFDGLTVWASNQYTMRDRETPEETLGGIVTPRFFRLLAMPVLGRAITEADERTPVAVISDALWRRRYDASPSVLGRSVDLSGTPHTIIGVMPAGFEYPSARFEVWVPLQHAMQTTPAQLENRSLRIFRVVAHLKPEVTFEQAQAELRAFSEQLQKEQPRTNESVIFELTSLREGLVGSVRSALFILLGAVGLVLLIACANVANLLLGLASGRAREIAVRRALGAPRGRLIRQLLTESMVLATIGAVTGVLLAYWLHRLVPRLGIQLPRMNDVTLDLRVLLFALGVALVTALLFGLVPAIQGSRGDLNESLKAGGRTAVGQRQGGKLRSTLVALEVAISVIVVVGAGLLVQSFVRVMNQDLGLEAEGLTSTSVGLFYFDEPAERVTRLEQVLERVAAIPGVEIVGAGSGLPPQTAQRGTGFAVAGRAPDQTERDGAYWIGAAPNYFAALGTRLIRGRVFTASDRSTAAPVAMINESLARALFPNSDPIGRQIQLTNEDAGPAWRTIVGVVQDIRYDGLEQPFVTTVYTPFAQTPFMWSYLMVRSSRSAAQLARPIREAIATVDPRMVPARVGEHTELVRDLVAQRKLITTLLGSFALIALLLAAVGIYGVIAHSVMQRRQEIGVRLALGAQPRTVLSQVIGRAIRLVAIGLAVGLIASIWLTRLLSSLLYNIGSADPITFVASGLIMLLVGATASAMPALRAARVDPLVALRS